MKVLVGIGFCMLLALPAALAGTFEDGIAAYDRKEFGTALSLWLPLAEQGNRAAQFNVGVLYERGLGVEPDAAEAARWYLKAAEQGDHEAQYNLGVLYENGAGVARDAGEARRWYAVVLAHRSSDPAVLAIKQRARSRLASLTTATEDVIAYEGGRYVIARSPESGCVIALQGFITDDGISRFDEVVRSSERAGCRNPWLLLESPGGLLFESLDLGARVRKAGFRTVSRSACASACAIIFLGGSERVLVGPRARIGLHQPARGRICDPTTYTSAARETAAYLKSVIPAGAEQVMALILQTSCDKIEWVYGQRAMELSVATRLD